MNMPQSYLPAELYNDLANYLANSDRTGLLLLSRLASETGASVLRKREKEESKVWLIEYSIWNSEHRYLDSTIDEDFGFFETEAEAEKRCEQLNGLTRKHYDSYVEDYLKNQEKSRAKFEQAVARNKFLVENGFDPVDTPILQWKERPPQDFTDWNRRNRNGTYAPVEVKHVEV